MSGRVVLGQHAKLMFAVLSKFRHECRIDLASAKVFATSFAMRKDSVNVLARMVSLTAILALAFLAVVPHHAFADIGGSHHTHATHSDDCDKLTMASVHLDGPSGRDTVPDQSVSPCCGGASCFSETIATISVSRAELVQGCELTLDGSRAVRPIETSPPRRPPRYL